MGRYETRYLVVPWGDLTPADLQPQGAPETELTYRREVHLGLHVRGTFGVTLGMLAVRCETHGSALEPLSLAIAETPPLVQLEVPAQSNPRRIAEPGEDV